MAETILYVAAQKILGKLASLPVQQFSLAWGLERDLKTLHATVSSITAVLSDADEQRFTDAKTSLWLRQLRRALHDAEDVLDLFSYEALRRRVVVNRKKKVRRFFSRSNPIAFRFRIDRKIKSVRVRLEEIRANKDEFDLNGGVDRGQRLRFRERELTNSLVNASEVIGRDGDRESIVKFLMDDSQDSVSVIPVVGIGGLGKTALAKLVFNYQRVVERFDTRVWVCLGDVKEFNVNLVMAKIVKAVTGESNSQQWENVIQDNFEGKRFLLVLDDVWDANRSKWLELKGLLAKGAVGGSKILVTTRDSSVALCFGTVCAHNLQGLPHDKCVSLFKKLAFASEAEVDENLMIIGDEIVRKCKGVPLAVRTLGSVLFSKLDEREWISVRDSGIWQLNEGENDILAILKFSYDNLPACLRQCFLSCSVFPEDYEFEDLSLISFWMAHGLLETPNNKQPEYVGKQYINEFLSRGFFQDFCQDRIWSCSFKMHDLVGELARSLSQDEFQIVDANHENVHENVRHVWFEEQPCFVNSKNSIRSVLVPHETNGSTFAFLKAFLPKFNNLRFLFIAYSELERLPNCIGTLKNMRALDLQGCTRLRKLPNSICKLHNLQTLSLYRCRGLEELPNSIGDLVNLRYLCVSTKQRHLPKNGIESLSSLQFLWFHDCRNLETVFEGPQIRLTSLRTLIVSRCQSLISVFQFSGYGNENTSLPALEVLEFRYCRNLNLHKELDGAPWFLHMPNLRFLKVKQLAQLEDLPDWIQTCSNTLTRLEIQECHNLGSLPEWLPNLTSLRTLNVEDCTKLLSLPEFISRLIALKEIEIVYCGQLSERCREEGEERFKIAHIPNILVE